MITVRFGQHLDGAYTSAPEGRIGHAVLGPSGFLGMLELHLGLAGLPVSPAERVVQYAAALKAADGPARFYHASLVADELGVAAELLSWRDSWYLHGWDGQPNAAMTGRLADIAEVEASAAGVAPGFGERLAAVLRKLSERKPPIADVEVVDPAETLPVMWRRVLALLPSRFEPLPLPTPAATFLGQLQQRLLAGVLPPAGQRLAWNDDGSVRIVQADSLLLAGRWLGESMSATTGDRLLVAGQHAQLLDDVLAGAQSARHGFSDYSAFRPGLQLLALAMALLWSPLDVYACLEFLTHPLCPIPARARRRLAAKLASRPGLAPDVIDAELPDLGDLYGEHAAQVRQQITDWLFQPRHRPEDGAPTAEAHAIAQRLGVFLRSRMADAEGNEGAALGTAHSQCRAVEAALQQLMDSGEARIQRPQLAKLIRQATAAGSTNPVLFAELGCALSTEQPGSVVRPVDHTYWWQLSCPPGAAKRVWSRSELRGLAGAGITMPSAAQLLEWQAQEWLRPILMARKTITLVLPPTGTELHPVWQLLGCHVDHLAAKPLAQMLNGQGSGIKLQRHPARTLPAPKRWWAVPAGAVNPTPDHAHSFSSLEKYIFNPVEWVLRYPAKLESSSILSLPDLFRLCGDLAHGLVERLFARPDALSMSAKVLGSWLDREIEILVDADGAVLRMPGRRLDLDHFRRQAHVAIQRLVEQLRQAGVTSVSAESALEGRFAGGLLTGMADLRVANHLNERGLLDLKWAGLNKYTKKLTYNTQLQLIVYSGLIAQMENAWPKSGYFILSNARLVAHEADYFPEAETVLAREQVSAPDLWNRFEASWKWRRDQIAGGRIEVALEGLEEELKLEPPAGCLALDELDVRYSEYTNLFGWKS